MTKYLCIIPARGGSKRIPRKNIKDFLGKPIIAYSIEAALKSNLFDEVMVSTDDAEIAEVAKQYGAKVPFMRSKKNADDHAILLDVITEVKDNYVKTGNSFDIICCILPTAPLLQVEDLKMSSKKFLDEDADALTPVVRFSYPIQRALKIVEGKIEMIQPQYRKTRSQDLEPAYYDAGQFYWMKFNQIKKSLKKIGYELPEIQVQDIDSEIDWKMAEMKYKTIEK
jgi:N-acylneuraminate cytidylyltransferase